MSQRLPRGVYTEQDEILRGVYPEWRFFSRGVYTEQDEILRYTQNDRKGEVLLQNDINEGLRMTEKAKCSIRMTKNEGLAMTG